MTPEPVQVRLLGRFEVVRDGRVLAAAAFGGRKVRTLLAVLAVHRNRHVSHDALADALWGDAQPADPAANLGVLVNRARRALGDPAVISTGPRGYALTGPCAIDAERFTEQVARARHETAAGFTAEALRTYRAALDGWAGEPLAEHADATWSQDYRNHLIGLRQAALEEAAQLAVSTGQPEVAVSLAATAVRAAPLREVAALRLAHAYEAGGDPASALDTLHRLRRALRDELGIDPSAEVSEALHRLLVDSDANARTRAVPQQPTATGESDRGQPPTVMLPLLGRDQQIEQLLAAVAGSGAALVEVSGPPGAGKSRLLRELIARLDRPVVLARAYLPEQAEPWSLIRSLVLSAIAQDRERVRALPRYAVHALADVVPDLADTLPASRPALDPTSRRALILEGSVRLLVATAASRAVLVVDDLQWADADSLVALADVLHRAPDLPAVLAFRSDEVAPDGAVRAALSAIAQYRVAQPIGLPALRGADLLGVLPADIARAVVEGTDGVPLAVGEVVRELVRLGSLRRAGPGRWQPPPGQDARAADRAAALGRAGRQRRLRAKVERARPLERTVLGLLSLLARHVTVDTLRVAAATDQAEVRQALAGLSAAGLARVGEAGWATSHDLVREAVVQILDRVERARLHASLAEALAAQNAEPAEVARHHAGAGDTRAAARCYAVAARSLAEASDDTGVAELVAAGLAAAGTGPVRAELLEIRAQVHFRRGRLAEARADLRAALAGTPEPAARSRQRARLAMLYSGAEDLHRAAGLAELAVLDAAADPTALAPALETAAIIDMNLGEVKRSEQRFAHALALYEAHGSSAGAARILDARAMAGFLDGHVTAAVGMFHRVADLFADSGELLRVVTPRSTEGHALVFAGDPASGLACTEVALELARLLRHEEGTTYALWHSAEALAALGRGDQALERALEGLAIAERLGHRGWTATSLRAVGIAHEARGDRDRAAEAYGRSLATASGLPLFASWAASRLAMTMIVAGDLDAAAVYVQRALAEGPPLAQFEARLGHAELLHARGDPSAPEVAGAAARLARDAGHLASLSRLEVLGKSEPRP